MLTQGHRLFDRYKESSILCRKFVDEMTTPQSRFAGQLP